MGGGGGGGGGGGECYNSRKLRTVPVSVKSKTSRSGHNT